MLSMYCTASMLPCGRYYYAPEGGYVGNPWVKFSYQYAYLYMAWIIHHLDIVEHYCFQYSRHIINKCVNSIKFNKLYRKNIQNNSLTYSSKTSNIKNNKFIFTNDYKLGMAWNSSIRFINR
jgi:hypothetical protein